MKYLFGPVNSRRLGLSLGVDLVPAKICNFNCIYCEVGATTDLTCRRGEYVPTADLLTEIDEFLAGRAGKRTFDVITITGSGEPTLHSGLGKVIRHLKAGTDKPVAVLTNGSLLSLAEVREELAAADIVIPSLDAAREESFRKINRPAGCARLESLLSGLTTFSREFHGQVWLEVLLVNGINDSSEDVKALQDAVTRIRPDRLQLNTVARPPLEKFAAAVGRERLAEIADRLAATFDGPVEILVDFHRREGGGGQQVEDEDIVEMLKRRPCTANDICEALGLEPASVAATLSRLERAGRIIPYQYEGRAYYQMKR